MSHKLFYHTKKGRETNYFGLAQIVTYVMFVFTVYTGLTLTFFPLSANYLTDMLTITNSFSQPLPERDHTASMVGAKVK